MAFFSGVAPSAPSSSTTAPVSGSSPQPSGGFFGSIKAPAQSTSPAKPSGFFGSVVPKISQQSNPAPTSTESPYWAGADAVGDTFGPATTTDPSGKPLLDYKQEGAQSTTTDKTRVDTTFDPLTAQPEPQSDIETPRTVSASEKAQIKQNAGAPNSDVIDHAMALTVAGSNEPENLRPLSNTENENDATFETDLDSQVKSGKISLFDAQKLEAANKGLPTPFTGTQSPSFWDKVSSYIKSGVNKVASGVAGLESGQNKTEQNASNEVSYGMHTLGSFLVNKIAGKGSTTPGTTAAANAAYLKGFFKAIPSAVAENLPFGVGDIVKQIEADPQNAADVNLDDVIQGLPQAGKDFVAGMVAQPALTIAGAVVAPFMAAKNPNGPQGGQITMNIPGLGEVSNLQADVARKVQNGENPWQAALDETPGAIFDTLAAVGLSEKFTSPREVTIAKGQASGVTPTEQPQSFREYKPAVSSTPIPNDVLSRIVQEKGITLKNSYDPKAPTFFRLSEDSTGKTVTPSLVQIKPSYLDTFLNKIHGDASAAPSNEVVPIYEQPVNVSDIIDQTNSVYENSSGKTNGNFVRSPEEGFNNSRDQKSVGENNGQRFELGTYGKNAIESKTASGKEDRLPVSEIPESIKNITQSYKSGDSPFRKDNTVHIAEMPNGEKHAIITRDNKNGNREVINYFKIGKDYTKFIDNLKQFGAPTENRTRIDSLEENRSNPLTYGGNENVSEENPNVKNKRTIIGRSGGPKVTEDQARGLIYKDIPQKDVNLIFDPTLTKTDSVHGRYTPSVKGILKPMIELHSPNGKISVRTAYHESFHYIFDNVLSPAEKAEALSSAKTELGKIKDFGYKVIGYKTADIRAEEYLADKYARQKTSEAGFDGPFHSFFKKISDFMKHIIDTVKRVGKKIKDTYNEIPNKQGGFIKAGPKETEENSDEEIDHIGDLVNPELSEKLDDIEQRSTQLSVRQEALKNNPAGKLSKYVNKKTGELPEALGKGSSIFERRGDDIATELGFKDSEEARSEYVKYASEKKSMQEDIKQLKQDKRDLLRSFKEDQVKNGPGAPEGMFNGEITEANKGVTPPIVRGGIHAPEMDLNKFRDIAAIRLGRDTMERNIEKVAGPYGDELKDFVIDPVRTNETDRIKFANDLRTEIRGKMKELKIKRGSDEDELIQRFGEGMMTREDLVKALPDTHEQVEKAADYFRKIYDDLIDKWNIERSKFDYKPVSKRPNYFRHFSDINQFTNSFGFLRSESQLSTEIAGQTAFFKPGKPFSTAELHRTGNRTSYSSMGGMDNYLDSVGKQMYHIDSIQRGRALEKYIREAGTANPNLKLANFVQNVQEWTNLVSGKAAMLDRAIESTVGRPVMKFMKGLSNLIGRNIIGGNISVALTHLVSTPFQAATTDKVPLIRGLFQTLVSPLKQDPITHVDGVESSFLTRRFPEKYIQPTVFDKTQNFINYLFHLTDMFKSKWTVAAKYYEGLNDGLSEEEAMKQADIYAGKIIGDYSIGNRPNLMNTHTTQLLAQFQLGVNDNLSVLMHDIPHWEQGNKSKIGARLLAFAIFSFLFNQIYKKIRGSGKGIDPIDAGLTLAGMNDEGKGQDFLTRLKLAGSDIAGELPFTSIAAGTFPLATAVVQPLENEITGNNRTGATETLLSDLASPVGAGGQIKKSVQGIEAYEKGQTTTTTGTKNQTVTPGPENLIKGAIFGETAFSGASTQNNQTNTLIGLLGANKNQATIQGEQEYQKLKAMPQAQAASAFTALQQTNPALAKTIIRIANEDKEGITLNERLTKELGVSDGQRAKYIARQLNDLPTQSAKAALWERYVSLKIISAQVAQQITPLLKK